MIALMKKDFRLILPILIGGVVLTAMPYAVAACAWMAASEHERAKGYLGDALQMAAYAGMWLVALLSCAFGGAAFAQERQQRSADFLAMLPVRRGRIVSSKVVVFVSVLGLLWLMHACVWVKLPSYFHSALNDRSDNTEIARLSGSSLLMIFGVAWLFSSFLASPTWAACIALVSMFALWMALTLPPADVYEIRALLSLSIGVASFLTGIIHYLFRIDP